LRTPCHHLHGSKQLPAPFRSVAIGHHDLGVRSTRRPSSACLDKGPPQRISHGHLPMGCRLQAKRLEVSIIVGDRRSPHESRWRFGPLRETKSPSITRTQRGIALGCTWERTFELGRKEGPIASAIVIKLPMVLSIASTGNIGKQFLDQFDEPELS
jgi:hypothetical protein